MIQRRSLLAGILSAGFAPAVIGSQVLMPVRKIVTQFDTLGEAIHSISLRGLKPNATYRIDVGFVADRLEVKDGNGKTLVYVDASEVVSKMTTREDAISLWSDALHKAAYRK